MAPWQSNCGIMNLWISCSKPDYKRQARFFLDVSKWANYLLFETISADKGLYEQIIYLLNLTYNKHTNNQRILKEKLYVIYINCLGHFNLMIRSNMTKRFTKLTEEKFETYYVPLLVKRVGAMNKMHLLRKNTHLIPKKRSPPKIFSPIPTL